MRGPSQGRAPALYFFTSHTGQAWMILCIVSYVVGRTCISAAFRIAESAAALAEASVAGLACARSRGPLNYAVGE